MSLIQSLPSGPLDIIGDIHGEYDALCNLLHLLGYAEDGSHAEDRTLVFVGDFCDRGPDSPAVIKRVEQLVKAGRAKAVLGNHEINLLREDPKSGSGWFFEERRQSDQDKYAPFATPDETSQANIVAFLSNLPIGLERPDLRVVHAAWINADIEKIRGLPLGSVRHHYDRWEEQTRRFAKAPDLQQRIQAELAHWPHSLEDKSKEPPFLHAQAEYDAIKQMMNPLKVLTSGVERKGLKPFYSSEKWRFAERVQWWNEYEDTIPVVVGHYWRRFNPIDRSSVGKGDPDLFESTQPHAWHGKNKNVFCVDFSVGGRWLARKQEQALEKDFKLAALRWPEKTLHFDDGRTVLTIDE